MDTKPGWKSSETYVMAFAKVLSILVMFGILDASKQVTWETAAADAIAGVFAILTFGAMARDFVKSRTLLKMPPSEPPAEGTTPPVAVEPPSNLPFTTAVLALILLGLFAGDVWAQAPTPVATRTAYLLPYRERTHRELERLRSENQQLRQQAPAPAPQPQIIFVPPAPQLSPPMQQIPLGGAPYQQIPLGGAPYQQLPLGGAPQQQVPLGQAPQQQLPLGAAPRQQLDLGPPGILKGEPPPPQLKLAPDNIPMGPAPQQLMPPAGGPTTQPPPTGPQRFGTAAATAAATKAIARPATLTR